MTRGARILRRDGVQRNFLYGIYREHSNGRYERAARTNRGASPAPESHRHLSLGNRRERSLFEEHENMLSAI